jgi:hypothetical protein
MTTDAPERLREVEAWRFDQAVKLGFTPRVATLIAGEGRIDMHELEALILAGAKRLVAYWILAP